MANPLRGETAVTADGDTRILVLDINALCVIEGETGLTVDRLGEALAERPSMTLIRTVFWACLKGREPGVTIEDAGALMSAIGLAEITATLTKLFTAAMPKAPKANPPKAPATA